MKQQILDAMQKCIDENQEAIDEASACDPIDRLHVSRLLMIQRGILDMQVAVLKTMIDYD